MVVTPSSDSYVILRKPLGPIHFSLYFVGIYSTLCGSLVVCLLTDVECI